MVIVCTENWILKYYESFDIKKGYKIDYNHSEFNQNDGVVIYVKTIIEKVDNLNVPRLELKMDDISFLKIAALNRCYKLSQDLKEENQLIFFYK